MLINHLNRMKQACEYAKHSNDPKCKVGVLIYYETEKMMSDPERECECQCYYYQKYYEEHEVLVREIEVIKGVNYLEVPKGISDSLFTSICNNDDIKQSITTHAEMKAILNINHGYKGRFTDKENATMYVTKFPCLDCAKAIVEVNIKNVHTARPYEVNPNTGKNSKWFENQQQALDFLLEKGVIVHFIDIEMKDSFPVIRQEPVKFERTV